MSLENNNIYEFEDFRINLSEQTFWYQDERISLAPKVFETLSVLLENQGRLMTKDELMDKIWGETFVEERNLTQNIFTLRKIFKEKRKGIKFIETVPRRGYRFVAELQPIQISSEETLTVNHKKSLHITAEGSVSKQELTEAVKAIAKDVLSEEKTQLTKQKELEPQKSDFTFLGFRLAIFAGILFLMFVGAAIWLWKNDSFTFRESAFARNSTRSQINFERLTDSGNVFYPAISPDKQFIAYIKNENEQHSILLKNIASGSETIIVPPEKYEMRSPQFSADGSYLFYGARDGKMETTVYKVPIFGGTPRQIVTNVNQNFSISPDGEQLAFFRNDPKTRGNRLVTCKNDGSDETIIAEKNDGEVFHVWESVPGWSPDGTKLAVVVVETIPEKNGKLKRPYLIEIDVKNGNETLIKSPSWENAVYAQWTSNGESLIVLAQDKPEDYFKLYKLSYPNGEANLLTNDNDNYKEFALAPNDEFLIATEERNPYNLQLIPIGNPFKIRSLTDSTRIQYGSRGLDWTPDGKFIVYSKIVGKSSIDIWKINVETAEQTRLTFDKEKMNKDMSVSPDGENIHYASNRTGVFQIWRMNTDGSNQEQITNITGGANFPSISPDGKWLIYATPAFKPDTLWKRSIQSGEETKLLTNAGGKSFLSPDMKTVIASYYDPDEKENDPWKFIFIPFDNKEKSSEIKSVPHIMDVSWNPDSRGIYTVSLGKSHSNINYFSIADETITQITHYESNIINAIKVAPDGKTIAAARGIRSSNFVRIEGF